MKTLAILMILVSPGARHSTPSTILLPSMEACVSAREAVLLATKDWWLANPTPENVICIPFTYREASQ